LSLWPDRARAADILQKTSATLWQKRAEFVPGSSFLAWARRIARYHVLNERRKLGRDVVVFDETLFQELLARHATRDELVGVPEFQLHALRACLQELGEPQRKLIEARYAVGGSVQRLAEETGKSVGAISQTLYRLREILRNCIELRLSSEASS
jgi:RNA polymerase sigma-70 factor (ECF subfamily)